MIAPRPRLILEGAFAADDAGNLCWADITDYLELDVAALDIAQRRQTIFDQPSPGTLSFHLNNSGKEFTKENINSPFYPGVTENTPLRVRAQYPTTDNLLTGAQSRTDDANDWTAVQGGLDTVTETQHWDFESGTQDWVATYGTVTQSTAYAHDGTHALLLTAGTPAAYWQAFSPAKIVSPGDKITVIAWVKAPAALGAVKIAINWDDESGYLGTTAGEPYALTAGQIIKLTVSGTAPETAVAAHAVVLDNEASPAGTQLLIDDVTYGNASTGPDVLTWATGILKKTGIRVATGSGPWKMPGDQPIHVKDGHTYSARLNLRADKAISVSLRAGWYDQLGHPLSEAASSTLALTTGWQTVSISDITAPADGELRISIANETTVEPVTAAISYRGGNSYLQPSGTRVMLDIPPEASAGDVALLWRRVSNKNASNANITGWTSAGAWSDTKGKTRLDWKVLTADDLGTTVTGTWDISCRAYGALAVYGGTDTTTPLDVTPTYAVESTFRTTHTTPNITTVTANCWITSAVFDVSTTTSVWTPPGGEITRQQGYGIKGNAPTGILTDDGTAHAIGTYGSKAFAANVASRYATMHTVALRPATVTGTDSASVYLREPIVVEGSLPAFTTAGNWTRLITAYADTWVQTWEVDRAIVAVTATDRSKLLAPRNIQSAIYETITDADPLAYYILDEGSDATEAADSSAWSQPTLLPMQAGTGGEIQWGEGTGPGVDGTAAVKLVPASSSNGKFLNGTLHTPFGNSTAVSAGFCLATSYAGTDEVTTFKTCPVSGSDYTRKYLEFYGKAGNYAGVKIRIGNDASTLNLSAQTSTNYFDGKTHRWAATCEIARGQITLKFYMDGELKATGTAATSRTYIMAMNSVSLGSAYRNARICSGTYSHLALYNTLVPVDDLIATWEAGDTAFAGETVTDRLSRLLDWEDQTGADFDDSLVTVDRHLADETPLLDALRLVADTDGGTLYINGNDEIAFRSATLKQTDSTPLLTLNAGALAETPASILDPAIVINDITINRRGAGTSQRLTDPASIDKNCRYDKTIDTLLTTDDEARAMGGYYLALYAWPYTRFDEIKIEALLLADWADLLAADMWKIVRLTNLPDTAPAATLDSFIEGRQWTITGDSWLVTFDVSYVLPFAVVGDPERGVMGKVVVAR